MSSPALKWDETSDQNMWCDFGRATNCDEESAVLERALPAAGQLPWWRLREERASGASDP